MRLNLSGDRACAFFVFLWIWRQGFRYKDELRRSETQTRVTGSAIKKGKKPFTLQLYLIFKIVHGAKQGCRTELNFELNFTTGVVKHCPKLPQTLVHVASLFIIVRSQKASFGPRGFLPFNFAYAIFWQL